MCTVTIHRNEDGILATMNRDEALTRAPELRPQIVYAGPGVRMIAPSDGERGGTWMGVNNHGVVACLLNAYQPGESLLPDTSGRFRTRGEIVAGLLSAGDGAAVQRWLRSSLDPHAYPSFTLMVATLLETVCYEWLGDAPPKVETLMDEWILRSSSGWDSEDVRRWRERRFAEWRGDGEAKFGTLPSFHLLRDPGHEERSPLMRRAWSATRSITQARVLPASGRVELKYWSEPTPASREPSSHASIPIARSRALARAR